MTNDFLDNWQYEDYLAAWEDCFGDVIFADYHYWSRGKEVPCTLQRPSEEEFKQHIKALKAAWDAFDQAVKANDDAAMDQALADAFPHELVLLV